MQYIHDIGKSCHQTKSYKIVYFFTFLLLFLLFFGGQSNAATFWSDRGGSFSNLNIWVSDTLTSTGNPTSVQNADSFIVRNGHVVTLGDTTPMVIALTIRSGGTFNNSDKTIEFMSLGGNPNTGKFNILSGGTYIHATGTLLFRNAFGTPQFNMELSQADTIYNLTLRDGPITFSAIPNDSELDLYCEGTFNVGTSAGAVSVDSIALRYDPSSALEYTVGANYTIGSEWRTRASIESDSTLYPGDVSLNSTGDLLQTSAGSRLLRGSLALTAGEISLGSDTLFVSDDIIGEVDGSGTINSSSTLQIGNSSIPDFPHTIKGQISLTNLIIDNTTTCEGQLQFAVNGELSVISDTLIFTSSGRLDPTNLGTLTLNISEGAVVKTGGQTLTGINTINADAGKIIFNSTSGGENFPTNKSIGILEINNTNGVQTTGPGTITILDSLNFVNGTVTTTSSNILLLEDTVIVDGAGSGNHVIGPMQRRVNSANAQNFPVGSTGRYRPATFTYADFTGGSNEIIEIEFNASDPGGNLPTGISQISTNAHYVLASISGTSPTSVTYNLTVRYTDTGFLPETRNKILVQDGTSPITYTVPGTQNYVILDDDVTAVGVTALPSDDDIIAFGSGGTTNNWTANTGNWNSAGNWSAGIPTATDDVVIDGATSIVTIPNGYSALAISLTMTDNSHLILANSSPGINFGTGSWNPALTTLTSGAIEYQNGSINVDSYNNLTVNGATTTSGSGSITVSGNMEKNGSTLVSSHSITVSGTYRNIAGNVNFGVSGIAANGSNFRIDAGDLSGTMVINTSTISSFGGSFTGTVTLSGLATQTINGSSNASFSNLVIDNENGVILDTTVSVSSTLTLIDGIVNTTVDLLTAAAVAGGSSSSYVQGPLAVSSATGTNVFPVGKGVYRPVTATGITSGGTPTAEVEVFDVSPTQSFDGLLVGISQVRYFVVNVTDAALTGGTVRLSYGSDDGVQEFNQSGDLVVTVSTDEGSTDAYSSVGGESSGSVPDGYVTSGDIGPLVPIGTYYFTLGTETGDNSLPVELSSFAAKVSFKEVILSWKTYSELENDGFNIYRRGADVAEDWSQVNQSMIQGQGNTSQATDYEYIDRTVAAGQKYEYMLESVSYSGVRVQEKVIEVDAPVPTDYSLLGNFPNPFNPTTEIRFQLPEKSEVTIKIYDIRGNLVDEPALKNSFDAGEHSVTWDAISKSGNNVASGMYIYHFQAGRFQKTGKMVLLK